MNKIILVFFICITSVFFGQAKDHFDKLNDEFLVSYRKDSNRALDILQEQSKLISQYSSVEQLNKKGIILQNKIDYAWNYLYPDDTLLSYLSQAEDLFISSGNKKKLISTLGRYVYLTKKKSFHLNKFDLAIKLAKELRDTNQVINQLTNKTYFYIQTGEFKKSNDQIKLALSYFPDTLNNKQKELKARLYLNLSGNFLEMGIKDSATSVLETAISLAYELKDTVLISASLNELARSYLHLQQYTDAKKYYLETYKLNINNSNCLQKNACIFSLASVYNELKEYDTSQLYLDEFFISSKPCQQRDFFKAKLVEIKNLIALNKPNAEHKLNDFLIKTKKEKNDVMTSYGYLYLAQYYYINALQYNDALESLDSCQSYINKSSFYLNQIPVYKCYIEIYDSIDNYEKQLIYTQKLNFYKDSIESIERKIAIDKSREGQKNTILSSKIDVLNEEIKNQENNLIAKKKQIIILILLGVLIFTLLIVFLIKKRKKNKKELEIWKKENRELRLQLINHQKKSAEKTNELKKINIDNTTVLIDKLKQDMDWTSFYIDIEESFGYKILDLLKHNNKISKSDCKYLVLSKLNLSNKEIAQILNITEEGAKKGKYRARKKIGSKELFLN